MIYRGAQFALSTVFVALLLAGLAEPQATQLPATTTTQSNNAAGPPGGNWGGSDGDGSGDDHWECYRFFGMAMRIVAALGIDDAGLCAPTGPLWSAMSQGQSCMSTTVPSVSLPQFSPLNTALSKCNALVSESSQSACSSLSQGTTCTVQPSYFGQAAIATTSTSSEIPTSSITTSLTPTPAPTVSEQPTLTQTELQTQFPNTTVSSTQNHTILPTSTIEPSPSQTIVQPNADNASRSNVAWVAGVAVGAALAGIIFAIVLVLVFLHCRRKRKRRSDHKPFLAPQTLPPRPLPSLNRIRQPHAELESPISDIQTPGVPSPIYRKVGGLQELDSLDRRTKETFAATAAHTSSSGATSGWRTWYSSGTSLNDSAEDL